MSSLEDRESLRRRDWPGRPLLPWPLIVLMFLLWLNLAIASFAMGFLLAGFTSTGDWRLGLLAFGLLHIIANQWGHR